MWSFYTLNLQHRWYPCYFGFLQTHTITFTYPEDLTFCDRAEFGWSYYISLDYFYYYFCEEFVDVMFLCSICSNDDVAGIYDSWVVITTECGPNRLIFLFDIFSEQCLLQGLQIQTDHRFISFLYLPNVINVEFYKTEKETNNPSIFIIRQVNFVLLLDIVKKERRLFVLFVYLVMYKWFITFNQK